tara:strand:+ start:15893 stop:16648 length:756 start_codon:yes stop_codon:yes gene_type:complete
MLKKRVIPILLLNNERLVKTIKYKNPQYVGDPINAVKIFNEKKVDEIIILDITRKKNININYTTIKNLADECRMPFSYGGGIVSVEQVEKLFSIGVEKVVLNTSILKEYKLIKDLSYNFGSQSIVVAIDINLNIFNKIKLFNWKYNKNLKKNIDAHIRNCLINGAGEILINLVYKEGTLSGFDYSIFDFINFDLNVPIIVNGGINSFEEIKTILENNKIDAIGIGAKFIYYGPHRAVLISYINEKDRKLIK